MSKENIECGVVHHIHHKAEDETNGREVSINGGIFSVSLTSNDPEENIEFLTEKALYILRKLKQEAQ